jgi:hypothetical protein
MRIHVGRNNNFKESAMANKPSIVFAHGLWADGSCFSKVIALLQSEGFECLSTQNSLDSLQGDVDAVI